MGATPSVSGRTSPSQWPSGRPLCESGPSTGSPRALRRSPSINTLSSYLSLSCSARGPIVIVVSQSPDTGRSSPAPGRPHPAVAVPLAAWGARQAPKLRNPRIILKDLPEDLSGEWLAAFSVGVRILDAQHKRLTDTIGSLYAQGVTSDLVDWTAYHFATEELLMEKSGYPEYLQHTGEHRELSEFITKVILGLNFSSTSSVGELCEYVRTWMDQHILKDDRKFAQWLLAPAQAHKVEELESLGIAIRNW
eukprot:m51a1_g8448 hypothetical protein (250) ;mRNA; r:392998-394034